LFPDESAASSFFRAARCEFVDGGPAIHKGKTGRLILRSAWRFAARYNGFFVATVIFALLIFRQFEPGLFLQRSLLASWRAWLLLVLLIYLMTRMTSFLRTRVLDNRRESAQFLEDFDTSYLILAATNVIIQLSGPYQSYFYSLNYLFMALFVIYLGIRFALFYALILPALEVIGLLVMGRPALEIYATGLFHAAMGLTFVGILGFFLLSERRARERAVDKLDRLTGDSKALAPNGDGSAPAVLREQTDAHDARHTRELDEEIGDLTEIARRGLEAEACVVLFVDHYGALLRVRAMSGNIKDLDEDAMVPMDSSISGLVLKQGKPLLIRRFDQRRNVLEYRRRQSHVRSCIFVPMYRNGEALGILVADSTREDAFDQDALGFLRRIGERIESAFHATQEVAAIDRERAEFAAYYEVVKKFAATLTLDDVLEVAIEAGRAILPFDAALLAFSDPERGTGTIAAVEGLPEKWDGLEYDEKTTLAGWVVHAKQYLLFKKSGEILKPLYHPECKFKGFESALILPLRFHDRVLGTLGFFWKRESAVTPYDLKLLETVAVHAATSLDSARMYERMEQLATTDGLTGLPNHRTFQSRLDAELARYKRLPSPISLIIMDIDHFKKVNDTFGHPVGDVVLREIGAVLAANVRDIDTAARYGGEEFALILPNTTAGGAMKFAERLRKHISKHEIPYPGGATTVTVSLGVACFPDDGKDKPSLIKRADEALYHSKQSGRNRVTASEEIAK
jgi:two-component system, cell cycle response regulator